MRTLGLAWLMLAAAMAGCLGGDAPDVPGPSITGDAALAAMTAEGAAHDHALPAHHQVAWNVEQLDQLLFKTDEHAPGIHALDVYGNLLFVGHTLSRRPGVTIVDVSDPAELRVLGSWEDPDATWGDRSVAVSEDGRYVFVGTEPPSGTSANRGVRVLDVSDPADVREVAFAPMVRGAHTVDTLTIDGETYVFSIDYGVTIQRLVEGPTGVQLVDVGRYEILTETVLDTPLDQSPEEQAAYQRLALIGHDARAVHDPELGPLLYVAFAYQGVHVLSITRPEAPTLLARWVPPGESPWYVHSVEVEVRDGQRVMAVGTEAVNAHHDAVPSPLWLVDATRIDAPELLSTWTNPAGTPAQELLFSMHWLRLAEGRLYVAHYHAGVWVLDVSTPRLQRAPEVIGAFLPATPLDLELDPDCCIRGQMNVAPYTYDVAVIGDAFFTADWQSGVHALRLARG